MTIWDIRSKFIEQIRTLPERLDEMVAGLDGRKLDTTYGEGKWSIRTLVHHLADSHINGFARFKWLLTEDNTILKTYNQDDWAALPDYEMPIEPSLAIIRGLHERWAYLLSNTSADVWTRTVQHPEDGEYTLDSLLEAYALHGEKHLGHIKQALARL
ncbi:MAG TPA: putative metal-dependent hydrolase [candidate division Zixibacteria bacterium]|nr:putative metal-dependent hydrolase [candidate division Zixibacteria bacterium]